MIDDHRGGAVDEKTPLSRAGPRLRQRERVRRLCPERRGQPLESIGDGGLLRSTGNGLRRLPEDPGSLLPGEVAHTGVIGRDLRVVVERAP